jgi:hypothetical protein
MLTAPLELLVIYHLGGPHGKHYFLLSRIVLGVFIDPLPSNRRHMVARVGSRWNVFTESSTSNVCTRHSIYISI